MSADILALAEEMRPHIVGLAQKLIQTPSISGAEGDLAQLLLTTMNELGYDKVFIDKIGNVVGIIEGSGTGPSIMYNSHMDHVAPGEESLWEYPPYGGTIADGFIHGRAASDVKCGMASQIYGGYLLKKSGIPFKGRYIFTGVVQEEPAEMFGMQHLCDTTFPENDLSFDLMVSSEATDLNLYLGHRGRVEIEVTSYGRTSHGSAPWLGVNAVYQMMPVLERVQEMAASLPEDNFLGQASCTLTRISCSPGELSITPDKCTVSLDRRLVRGETPQGAIQEIEGILKELGERDDDFKAEAHIRTVTEKSYTGISAECPKYMHAWVTEPDHPYVKNCISGLEKIGQSPSFGRWDFGTDASYVTGVLGIPTIGYSPMEEQYAHRPIDRCNIDKMVQATAGNAAIALEIMS